MNGHTDTMEMKERADSNGAVLSDSSDGHAKSEKGKITRSYPIKSFRENLIEKIF